MSSYHGWTHAPKAQGGTDPIPLPGSAIEWARAESATDLGSSYTILDWTALVGEFDSTVPTFSINGNANLTIGKDGSYDLFFEVYSEIINAAVDTMFFAEIKRVSGAIPETSLDQFSAGEASELIRRLDSTGTFDQFQTRRPTHHIPLAYSDGAIAGGGVSEIQVRCYYEEDGVGVANVNPDFQLMLRRLGDPFVG